MLASIFSKVFVALYRYLYMRYVNAFKTNMNYNHCFNNIKSKRYLYCINKKGSCILVNTLNFFFAS